MAIAIGPIGVTFNDSTSITTNPIPSGTTLLFYQANAPTGWTKVTTQDNKALRVVSGTGGGSGGSSSFTSVFTSRGVPLPQHAHGGNTGGESDNHVHGYTNPKVGDLAGLGYDESGSAVEYPYDNASATGGTSNGHYHGFVTDHAGTPGASMDFAVQYIDVIIASKN